ncbi:flagellar export protein FliJ [Clostridium sp. UBA1056]|uniref:flagellar export protein FliJ n=1 Tax=unclassified Clostridium TaxID=2614128 RepID=UPI003217D374
MGQNYKFKLQRLLDIREQEEEGKKIVFMEALRNKNKVEAELKDLEDSFEKYSIVTNDMNTTERKIQHHYLNLLNSTIGITKEKLKTDEAKVESTRKELVTAQVNKKIVSILKEKDKEKFIKEENRIEQIQNDEFALYGFLREGGRR